MANFEPRKFKTMEGFIITQRIPGHNNLWQMSQCNNSYIDFSVNQWYRKKMNELRNTGPFKLEEGSWQFCMVNKQALINKIQNEPYDGIYVFKIYEDDNIPARWNLIFNKDEAIRKIKATISCYAQKIEHPADPAEEKEASSN